MRFAEKWTGMSFELAAPDAGRGGTGTTDAGGSAVEEGWEEGGTSPSRCSITSMAGGSASVTPSVDGVVEISVAVNGVASGRSDDSTGRVSHASMADPVVQECTAWVGE